eukprot:3577020-Pleurochrysis_carterae.AAC.2
MTNSAVLSLVPCSSPNLGASESRSFRRTSRSVCDGIKFPSESNRDAQKSEHISPSSLVWIFLLLIRTTCLQLSLSSLLIRNWKARTGRFHRKAHDSRSATVPNTSRVLQSSLKQDDMLTLMLMLMWILILVLAWGLMTML